jgi:hypothetical protein
MTVLFLLSSHVLQLLDLNEYCLVIAQYFVKLFKISTYILIFEVIIL